MPLHLDISYILHHTGLSELEDKTADMVIMKNSSPQPTLSH